MNNRSQLLTAQAALEQTQGRVLLVNPPVIDTRYSWIRWNQPLDLLKLSTDLKATQDCEVKLFDFLLPAPTGSVPRRQSRTETEAELPSGEAIRWQFGQFWEVFDSYLDSLAKDRWIPDAVWVTTLTSFWWQTVPLVANRVKNKFRRAAVILYGNYPVLETAHACSCPNVDIVVEDYIDLSRWKADFSLYSAKLSFCALDLRSPDPIEEIDSALKRGTHDFVFFNDDIFGDFDRCLKPVLMEVGQKQWQLQFHAICGVEISSFPIGSAHLLSSAHFRELHFEPRYRDDGTIDEPHYRAVMEDCEQAKLATRRGSGWESEDSSAFLWIGRPDDDLDQLVWNALKLLQLVGMVIPKPYSPTPGTGDYKTLVSEAGYLEPEDISPHRLPFAGRNGMTKEDYADLYRLTALLNSKVRSHTFDFLGTSYLAKTVRDSVFGKRWAI